MHIASKFKTKTDSRMPEWDCKITESQMKA